MFFSFFSNFSKNVHQLLHSQYCEMRLFSFQLIFQTFFRKYLGQGKGWTLSFIWSRPSNGLCKQMDFYYPCCQYFHVLSLCSLKTIEKKISSIVKFNLIATSIIGEILFSGNIILPSRFHFTF